jgi:hypothetical protein
MNRRRSFSLNNEYFTQQRTFHPTIHPKSWKITRNFHFRALNLWMDNPQNDRYRWNLREITRKLPTRQFDQRDCQNERYPKRYWYWEIFNSIADQTKHRDRPTESESASNSKILLHISLNLHNLLGMREPLDLLHSMMFPLLSLRRRFRRHSSINMLDLEG